MPSEWNVQTTSAIKYLKCGQVKNLFLSKDNKAPNYRYSNRDEYGNRDLTDISGSGTTSSRLTVGVGARRRRERREDL